MSNYLAISTVTESMRHFFQRIMEEVEPGSRAMARRPSSLEEEHGFVGCNLFLYQVSLNAYSRNRDLPTRDANGKLLSTPLLGLELHYIVSFYGESKETLLAQRLLGRVMSAIHAEPVLSRADIEAAQQNRALRHSTLQDDQSVRLTFTDFNLEEWSKLWSVMIQTPYVLSIGLRASVLTLATPDRPADRPVVREVSIT